MRALITILDNITETSMPFNEFVLYRANHFPDEKQILIICGKEQPLPAVDIPSKVEIIYTGKNPINIRKTIKAIIYRLQKKNISFAIHMHQVQSGFLAELAMFGTGFRKKVLFTVHSTFSGYKIHNKFLSFSNALLAHRVTCVSNASYSDYPKIVKKMKKARMCALQNGVDTERIDEVLAENTSLHNHQKDHSKYNFIYVARMIPLKNHCFLVDIIKKCNNNVHFIFVGAEDSEQTVRNKAKKNDVLDRITFTGLIPRNEVFNMLMSADYYISSSTLEGLPVSVLEAMYCGLPCILSDIPQHREISCENLVFLPFETEKWVTKINEFSMLSIQEKQLIAGSVKKYVQANFSLRSMHEKYSAIYKKLY